MRQISCGEDKKAKDKDYCQKSVCISDNCWIERPKFFNGQLLTDTDLKAGMDYVIEKNKLHNRYLHGWGVACGLKVKCYPCCEGHGSSGKVVVEPGYAIDCCGNDIVVYAEQEFDVVKRINEMKAKKAAEQSPCEPAAAQPVTPCSNGEEKYYLVLSYKEEDAKPATALRADDPCSIQRCVPSRTKECFELHLVEYCTLEEKPEDNLVTRVLECIRIFIETWVRFIPKEKTDFSKITDVELKDFIRGYYKALSSHVRCDVLNQLEETNGLEAKECKIDEPETVNQLLFLLHPQRDIKTLKDFLFEHCRISITTDATRKKNTTTDDFEIIDDNTYTIHFSRDEYDKIVSATISWNEDQKKQLQSLVFSLLFDCICQALLPSCPTCIEDDVLILATITVKNNKIHQICNLSRKILLTSLSFNYWVSPILDLGVKALNHQLDTGNIYGQKVELNSFSDLMEFLCCDFDISQVQVPVQKLSNRLLNLIIMVTTVLESIGVPFTNAFSTASKEFFSTFDPQNISLESALNKKSKDSASILKNLDIEVVGKEKYAPSLKSFSLGEIFSTIPFARPGSKVIQLVDDNDNVVGFRKVKEKPKAEPTAAEKEMSLLKTELEKMSKKMAAMEKELKEMKKKTPGPKATGTKKK